MRGPKRGALLLGATMLLAAGSLAAQSWRGAAGLEIRVSSRKKGPVSNAVVELKYRGGRSDVGPPPVATDAKGRALVVGLANGTWQVEVQHPDFMSFVAVVQLDSRAKPQITASFLQASATQSTPIQVKLLKAKGGTPSSPLPLAARPQPPVVEPVRTPEPRPAPEPAAPAAEPDEIIPPIAEAAAVEPAPEPKATEPVAPAPEASVPEMPVSETAAPERPAPAMPAPEIAQPQPEPPVAAPEPTPQPPATLPSPDPSPTPPPVEPEPPAPQPAPEPPAEPPAIEHEAQTEPEEIKPVESPVSLKVPEVELQPPTPEPSQPVPAPPTAEAPPATTPMPTPIAVATLEPEPEPAAESAAPTAPPPVPTLPPMAAPEWRSYRHRTCPECRPGEWAVSVAAALAGDGTCSADVSDGVAAALAVLGGRGALELAGFAGGLDAAAKVVGASAGKVGTAVAAAGSGGCRVLAVVLPKASRFVGFQFEIDGSDGRRPCLPDQPCPGGTASFAGPPKIARGAAATVVHALAHGSSGEALMTVFFRAPNSNWTP